jgi:hypothetical protein
MKDYKDRTEYFRQRYREKQKEQRLKKDNYSAESIHVLLSFVDYLSLNQEGAEYFERFKHSLTEAVNQPTNLSKLVSLLQEAGRLSRSY